MTIHLKLNNVVLVFSKLIHGCDNNAAALLTFLPLWFAKLSLSGCQNFKCVLQNLYRFYDKINVKKYYIPYISFVLVKGHCYGKDVPGYDWWRAGPGPHQDQ